MAFVNEATGPPQHSMIHDEHPRQDLDKASGLDSAKTPYLSDNHAIFPAQYQAIFPTKMTAWPLSYVWSLKNFQNQE